LIRKLQEKEEQERAEVKKILELHNQSTFKKINWKVNEKSIEVPVIVAPQPKVVKKTPFKLTRLSPYRQRRN
jgi:hypothetical protein